MVTLNMHLVALRVPSRGHSSAARLRSGLVYWTLQTAHTDKGHSSNVSCGKMAKWTGCFLPKWSYLSIHLIENLKSVRYIHAEHRWTDPVEAGHGQGNAAGLDHSWGLHVPGCIGITWSLDRR